MFVQTYKSAVLVHTSGVCGGCGDVALEGEGVHDEVDGYVCRVLREEQVVSPRSGIRYNIVRYGGG